MIIRKRKDKVEEARNLPNNAADYNNNNIQLENQFLHLAKHVKRA